MTDAPNILVSILDILFGFLSDVDFIELSVFFYQHADINKDFMELFSWIGLLSLVFKHKDALALIKSEIESFLAMSFNKDAFDVFKRKVDESFQ